MGSGQYFRVCSKLRNIPADYHEFGFETETAWLTVVHKVFNVWTGHRGECIGQQKYMRLLRFRNAYGGYEDAWIYDFMLEQVPAPEEWQRDREAEALEEELDRIFGFN